MTSYLLGQLLTRSAGRWPDRTAVVHKQRSLSYHDLKTLSNQLARLLLARGVRRGDRVGICLNKSIESVIAVFGILEAGAVYVPLDPAAPASRLAFIVGNCDMRALVTNGKKLEDLQRVLQGNSSLQCVLLTEDAAAMADDVRSKAGVVGWQELASLPGDLNVPSGAIEDDLAYILYTSGSTGEPKGVMISHRASLTFVNWAYDCFGVERTDRVSNHAPLHFDLSIFDIFVAVKAGASIVLVPDELSVFPIDLANFIEREGITVWYSVPSALTRLVLYGELGRHQFSSLRQVLFAGEVFPIKYLRLLRAAIPHATYYNLYGPTETNVCTYYRVGEIAPERTEPIPIGTACANTEVFAITDRLEVASLGEVGELYVRGPSLMKGYWGMPERTAEVLFPNPWRDAVWGDTVYRTGDLVRQNEAGNYVFLGRRDNLIKSRGYRIELGEIETVLYRHPEIEEAAAIAIPDEEIGNVIRAVVVPRDASRLTAGELQALCAERLPKYMIPAEFEFRASLPRTSTGKVDKWSLVREQLEGKEASSSPGPAVDPA